MAARALVFAACAYNLAETTRMLEIARAVTRENQREHRFEVQFISDGGEFESLIENAGFPLKRLEPRMTAEKIEYAYRLDRGEAFGSVMSADEAIEKIRNEVAFLQELKPAAIVTGSYVTMPITHQVIDVPLVWVVQSTWLEGFFKHGAGMTDHLRFRPVKRIADFAIYSLINLWTQVGLLHPLNQAADHYGVRRIRTIFEYYHGDLNLVAEPPDFTETVLPGEYRYIGPIVAREDFPVPKEILAIPRDKPLVYFAMGSSGTPEMVAKIVASFAGKPYRVIAPVRSLLEKVSRAHVPPNVMVTGWLPALQINRMADISVIHGGIGTVMTAAYAGKPIVGVGMQPEQTANLSAIAKKGFAIRIPRTKDPSAKILEAIETLLHNEKAHARAKEFAASLEGWDGPNRAAQILMETYGK